MSEKAPLPTKKRRNKVLQSVAVALPLIAGTPEVAEASGYNTSYYVGEAFHAADEASRVLNEFEQYNLRKNEYDVDDQMAISACETDLARYKVKMNGYIRDLPKKGYIPGTDEYNDQMTLILSGYKDKVIQRIGGLTLRLNGTDRNRAFSRYQRNQAIGSAVGNVLRGLLRGR